MTRKRSKCKTHITLIIKLHMPYTRKLFTVKAEYHPKGCMHASTNHIDIEPQKHLNIITELLQPRGLSLTCENEDNGITLILSDLDVMLEIRSLIHDKLRCEGKKAYMMITRRGKLYIAPILLRKHNPRDGI